MEQDTAPTEFIHATAEFARYKASLVRVLNAIAPPKEISLEQCVFIPKPPTLAAFYETHADDVLLRGGFALTSLLVYEKRMGGYVFKFTTAEHALSFAKSFPRDVEINKKVHCFAVA